MATASPLFTERVPPPRGEEQTLQAPPQQWEVLSQECAVPTPSIQGPHHELCPAPEGARTPECPAT